MKTFKIDYYLIFVVIIIYSLYLPTYLNQYVLSGDDLFLILQAPSSLELFFGKLTNFTGQYRPLTHTLFAVYGWLLSYSDVFVKLVHFSLILLISVVWYSTLKLVVRPIESAFFTIATMISPILFYHVYAIASLNNLLIILFGITLLYINVYIDDQSTFFSSNKKKLFILLTSLLLVLSVLAKETFIPLVWLVIIINYRLLKLQQFIMSLALTGMLFLAYVYFRVSEYTVTSSEYSFVFNFEVVTQNVKLFGSWLLGYPTGWQYAAADPKTFITYVIPLLFIFLYGLTGYTLLSQKKLRKYLAHSAILLALALLPFLFLQRVLVFYLDFTWFVLLFMVVVAFKYSEHKRIKMFLLVGMLLCTVLQFYAYHPQWHKHSFVSHANITAKKLLKVASTHTNASEDTFANIDLICIKNHDKGYWATAHGRILILYKVTKSRIVSSLDDILPDECYEPSNSVILLENDGWEYK